MDKSENIPLEPVQNYMRLQHLLNYVALPLLKKTFTEQWKRKYEREWKNSAEQGTEFIADVGAALFKDARKIQKQLLKAGDIDKWDVPLMIDALKCFNKSSKEQLKSFNKLIEVRNQLSHHSGLIINNETFEDMWISTSNALIIFGITQCELEKAKTVSVQEDKENVRKADELKVAGNLYVNSGKFEVAVKKYTEAISQPGLPSNVLAILHSNRAWAYLKIGNYYKAKDDAVGATLLNPSWWRGFSRLGHVYLSVDKYEKALANFEKAVALDPHCKMENERDHCRHMIAKIKRDEHLDPMMHFPTLAERNSRMMEKLNISSSSLAIRDMMSETLNLKELPVQMCAEGHKYQHGMGVTQNYRTAAMWFAKAAAKGNAEGYYNLALLTKEGKGVRIDVAESIRLMKLAAAQDICIDFFGVKAPNIGVVEAEHCLGLSYQQGVGVPQDFGKAFEWYTRAIKHGSGISANNIGCMYSRGSGVPLNIRIALNYYKLGAALKVVRAMENVAETYLLLLDKEETRKWFQFAISKGSLQLQSKRQVFLDLVGSTLETPIQEDVFELELMEDIKTGPLAHLIGKGLNTEELRLQALGPFLQSDNEKSDSAVATSRASLGLKDPYRVEIITCHRTELKNQRSEKRMYEKGEGNLLPRPVVDLFTLKQIHFADMNPKKDHVYEGFAIKLTLIEDAITGRPSINQIAEDEHGDAQRIFIYNFPQNADTQNKIGFGCKVTVVNPYFRLARDGKPMIRVDDISLMFLHSNTTNKKRCRYCGDECELTVPCRHCKRSFYCSKVCLKNDTMELNHRDVCVKRL